MLRTPPLIIAHRGASGYEYENSPAAFRRAAALGADGVELDVHATADGALVVHHDPDLPGLGPISHLPAARVTDYRLPNGERLPLLADVLSLLGDLSAWVEVKAVPQPAEPMLLRTLRAGPAPHRYAIHGFDHELIRRLGELAPELPRGILVSSPREDPVVVLQGAGATTLWAEWTLVERELVERVHAAGGSVIAWTVNRDRVAQRLTRLGVDGLCGNYPDRLREVAAAALDPDAGSGQ